MPFTAAPIELDAGTRRELERRVAAATTPQRDARRARIILLAADGVSSSQISRQVEMHESNVAQWRARFLANGVNGLDDRPRSGRPPVYGHDDWLKMTALATSERDRSDPQAVWTYQQLADRLAADVGISRSQLWRILDSLHIKPHVVRGWLNRRDDDPLFWDRVRDVCGLYLNQPANALVLSVDEKTSIQARERRAPMSPAGPDRPARQEWEYIRHGVAHLIAALEVHSGTITADVITKNDSINFCAFLDDIDHRVDRALQIHLILDNGAAHTSNATKAWLAERPRFVVHYTPKHASWVNQIEIFFSILARKVLRHGDFNSRDDLIDKLMRYIRDYNNTAHPFAWTYAGKPLTADHTRGTYARRH